MAAKADASQSFSVLAKGEQFASFIRSSLRMPVAPPQDDSMAFSLLVAFGRCRFRLDENFVAKTLGAFLGCFPESLHVCQLEDRIFLFTVSCKAVGLAVYNIRCCSCSEFEFFFQLFNESGLSLARSHVSNEVVSPWIDVGQKHSGSNSSSRLNVLTGANAIPLNPQAQKVNGRFQAPRSHRRTVFDRLQFDRNQAFSSQRRSVFDRLQAPRISVFDRLNWHSWKDKMMNGGGSSLHLNSNNAVPAVHPSTNEPASLDLNLDLNLGLNAAVIGAVPKETSLVTVHCRRCLSPSHSRNACSFPIKCVKCLKWGHVAASCNENWKRLLENMNGKAVDNFARDFGPTSDYSGWFNPGRMTAGPSSPPRFNSFSELRVVASASRPIYQHQVIASSTPAPFTVHPRNPNSLASQSGDIEAPEMAYFRADPAPFTPHGLNRLEIQGRKPMERVVMMRPRTRNHDLAIASIHPMPEHQVTFQAIRGVLTDFLTNEQRVEFLDMQPTHLGQSFVRFRNVYDKDRLVQDSPFQFGNVSISFVDHNRGRNWRAVNFNRECWLLLLGFPPDFREDEFVVNTLSSFGRVLFWVDDERHLSRLLVRARVIDYESIPQFLVVTDGDGFQAESWTVQCEVLQGNLLGGLPQDEAPAPGPDDFPPNGPFDLFGFGQHGNGPVFHHIQHDGPNPPPGPGGHPGQGFGGHGAGAAGDDHGPFINLNADPGLNLNLMPEDPELDLNVPVDMQEVVVDPVFGGPEAQDAAPELNFPFEQVNEEEEDLLVAVENALDPGLGALANNPVGMEIVMPDHLEPLMPLEILEEDLMNDDEIQQMIDEEEAQNINNEPNNMHVGFVVLRETTPRFHSVSMGSGLPADDFGPWAKFFAPKGIDGLPSFLVPKDWAQFFTAILLSPSHFKIAKDFIKSSKLLSCLSEAESLSFSLPAKCPVDAFPNCPFSGLNSPQLEPPASPVMMKDSMEKIGGISVPSNEGSKKNEVLVENQVRRSPRLLIKRNGFKGGTCNDKNCLGCNASPPTLSSCSIRKLGSSLCDLQATDLTDEALNSKKLKKQAPKQKKSVAGKNKKPETHPVVDVSSVTEEKTK